MNWAEKLRLVLPELPGLVLPELPELVLPELPELVLPGLPELLLPGLPELLLPGLPGLGLPQRFWESLWEIKGSGAEGGKFPVGKNLWDVSLEKKEGSPTGCTSICAFCCSATGR
ncbi:unnamed protein product [Anisakis simplex]|uniref:Uncharacterized protein n=1 Tax=Anisakis simplex TaxID=6269 RepID=A0A3P6SNF1_ANISI|nr:unnamed protein product [Anisakis simplex]